MKKKFSAFHVFIFVFFVGLSSCKKENENPQWDISVFGPLIHASLSVEQLDGDSSISSDGSGAQLVSIDTLLSMINLDTLAMVQDTSFRTVTFFPPFPGSLPPNSSFPQNNNNIALGLGSVQLKRAVIGSGSIRLDIKNTLQTKIFFTYDIPKAKKNGIAFHATAEVAAGSASNPQFFTQDYDLSGYDMDLTGVSGTTFNSIAYNITATTDPNGSTISVAPSETLIDLTTSLLSIEPSYAQGYLGQQSNTSSSVTNINVTKKFRSGLINLDSMTMNLDLVNWIGTDAQLLINGMRSINTRTNTTVDLIAPSVLNNPININRASETGNPADPVNPTDYSIVLDNNNSNLVPFIENLPDQVYNDFQLEINPLGNISGNNDFIYTDKLLDTRLRVNMPLRFAANQLVMSDTVPFSIDSTTDFDPVGPATLALIAVNGFPLDLNVQMFLLDSNNQVTDSLFVPDFIAHAPYDINYIATGTTRSAIPITIDETRKEKLLNVKQVGIRIRVNTPDYPQLIQLYEHYKIELKLIADGLYMIR